jgi:hypothetical protein
MGFTGVGVKEGPQVSYPEATINYNAPASFSDAIPHLLVFLFAADYD